jgi:hypothetical protein
VFVATETAGPRARLVAVLVAVAAGLAVAGVQIVVQWQGDRAEYLLLAGFNALLASLATWFFHIRWRLLDDSFDMSFFQSPAIFFCCWHSRHC